tara:strand:- start:149 stop:568 length:420 start_codon:yes stop_codon:yes gene_type:complete
MSENMQFEGRQRIRHGINLVPLINIVFLLLIFFMLSSTLITPDKFDIQLPESDKGDSHESVPIVILLRGDGTIALNNVAASLTELSDLLVSEIEAGAQPELMVRADALANTKDVIAVLRQAKIAGIEAVSLATQPNTFR